MTARKKTSPLPGSDFGGDQEITTFRYRGPDRREGRSFELGDLLSPDEKLGDVTFDAKGNPIWQLKVELPRRRKDDNTLDLIKCLEVDTIALADEADNDEAPKVRGYNPYGIVDD
jgi:hypothetical protein